VHYIAFMCEEKYAKENMQHTQYLRARARARVCVCVCVCVCKQEKARVQKTKYAKEGYRKKRENSRDQVQRYSNPASVSFHSCCRSREEGSGVRLIKIRIASYISRRIHIGAYLCFSWEMYHMGKFTIFLYILKISIFRNIILFYYFGYSLKSISFDSIK